jgi:type I restriction-modification system DNA methylase subunit
MPLSWNEIRQRADNFVLEWKDKKTNYNSVNPVNIEAAEYMGKLYDSLKENNYKEHELEIYLVRILFCLFADATGIFKEKGVFYEYIKSKTKEDGSDLALHLNMIFQVLNKEENDRQKNIDEIFKKFPYVNGGLFEKRLETASFDSNMRNRLLKCCELDWSKINPEIFGAMFQSVKDKEKRRILGEHYTSEANILKIVKPLFLDKLWDEFNKIRELTSAVKQQQLLEFHGKLQKLKFLDPACGCGNFLVVSYRELRLLEIEVLLEYLKKQQLLDIELMVGVNVDQFYGIEIEDFPARIAQTALWLMDHIMNNKASEKLGKYIIRIPLAATPNIVIGNALTTDWESVVPKNELSYILGNPPFIGSRIMNRQQKAEVEKTFNGLKNFGDLDYVTCWYKKAAEYIQGTEIEVAFVSTNSICQGLQVPILWPELFNKYRIKINFAHQTFKWSNEARGKAAVYCVIIGFALADRNTKKIYQYAAVTSDPVETSAKQINADLVDYDNIFIKSREKPLCDVPPMNFGNMPADGGELLFTEEEKEQFLRDEPGAKKYFRRFISAHEFLNKGDRWCLWLVDIEPAKLKTLKLVYERVKKVKEIREKSARPFLADIPHLFAQITQPKGKDYILIPSTSSETRKYIPIGFFTAQHIAANSCHIIPDGTVYHFGILTSTMHMAWTRYVCGRLEMRYRYSKDIVYNNFPWPDPTEKQKAEIEKTAQGILDTRAQFPDASLADLYDPVAMPPVLLKAHQKLDKAVETAYGRAFDDDGQRVAYLFELYQKLTGELFVDDKKRGKGRKKMKSIIAKNLL